MKDLLSSPSPHKEPPRPGRRESLLASSSSLIIAGSLSVCACMLERQNERGTVLLNVISFFLNYLFNFPCFESNVAVSVLCSDVPAPGRRHSFHWGNKNCWGSSSFFFLVLGIFVAPLWYKEDTWLDNLILLLMGPREVNITLSIDAILTRSGPSCTLAPRTFCFFSVH